MSDYFSVQKDFVVVIASKADLNLLPFRGFDPAGSKIDKMIFDWRKLVVQIKTFRILELMRFPDCLDFPVVTDPPFIGDVKRGDHFELIGLENHIIAQTRIRIGFLFGAETVGFQTGFPIVHNIAGKRSADQPVRDKTFRIGAALLLRKKQKSEAETEDRNDFFLFHKSPPIKFFVIKILTSSPIYYMLYRISI